MFLYAQLDKEDICISISQLSGEVIADNMIALTEHEDVLGKQYINGEWREVILPESVAPPLTETEQAVLQTAINTEYLLYLMESTI